MPAPARDALFASGERLTLGVGGTLYRSGDPPGVFHGVVEGAIKVSTLREDGREAILTIIEPGNWFGEMSMVDGLPRTHDATAHAPSELLTVRQADFDQLMLRPDFARCIANLLAIRMRLLFAVFEDATLHSTQARVARRLLLLSRGDATPTSERRHLIKVSQTILAMMLGITRQTLSSELKRMADAGAIATHYGSIEIRSHAALLKLARAGSDAAGVGSTRIVLDETRKPTRWSGDERRVRPR